MSCDREIFTSCPEVFTPHGQLDIRRIPVIKVPATRIVPASSERILHRNLFPSIMLPKSIGLGILITIEESALIVDKNMSPYKSVYTIFKGVFIGIYPSVSDFHQNLKIWIPFDSVNAATR